MVDENARIELLIESFRGDFRIFGEKLDLQAQKLDDFRDETNRRFDFLGTEVAVLKCDVAVLKTDVAVLKTDVAVLQSGMATLQTSVANLESRMGDVQPRVVRIERHLNLSPPRRKGTPSVRRRKPR